MWRCLGCGLVFGLVLAHFPASAQGTRLLSLFRRGHPKIQTLVFVRQPTPYLAKQQVGVFHFPTPSYGDPAPPPFGEILQEAVLAQGTAASAVVLDGVSWDSGKLSKAEQIAAAARYARSQNLERAILGRVDPLFRRTSGGLVVKITLWVVSADGEVLWYGVKKAAWTRYIQTEDCFRVVAGSFLKDLNPLQTPVGP